MKKYTLILSLFFGTFIANAAGSQSSFSNPYFLIAILLFIILIALALLLPSVIKSLANQVKKKKKTTTLLVLFSLLGTQSYASGDLVDSSIISSIDTPAFMLILAAIVLAATFVTMFKTIFKLSNYLKTDEELASEKEEPSAFKSLLNVATDNVALEDEKDILLDHDYDGIHELDNNLPPWWVAFFYITILFGVVYIFQVHISKSMPFQLEEYNQEVAEAKEALDKFKATSTNFIDETNVVMLDDAASIETGKKLFASSCAACHGGNGEGLVGPNLTDKFWIHGGDVKSVFKTIKYGVPDKGMIAWKAQLKGPQMQKITSYILSELVGTNPSGGKAPEGEEYIPTTTEVEETTEEIKE